MPEKKWKYIFKIFKRKCELRILYLGKLTFDYKGQKL